MNYVWVRTPLRELKQKSHVCLRSNGMTGCSNADPRPTAVPSRHNPIPARRQSGPVLDHQAVERLLLQAMDVLRTGVAAFGMCGRRRSLSSSMTSTAAASGPLAPSVGRDQRVARTREASPCHTPEGSPSPSQCSHASDHEALLRSTSSPTFVGRRPLVGLAIQVSESIHRSRRRPSRAMSSGSRSVLVSNEIP